MSNDNGGPAFPMRNRIASSRNAYGDQGVDMRDYFAAKAMQGLAGKYAVVEVVRAAYEHADAMLKERAK